jgi:hypothetical protein
MVPDFAGPGKREEQPPEHKMLGFGAAVPHKWCDFACHHP